MGNKTTQIFGSTHALNYQAVISVESAVPLIIPGLYLKKYPGS